MKKMENFDNEIAELLEVDSVNDDDALDGFEAWDSLTILSIIAHADETYNVVITADEVSNCKTVGGLKELISFKADAKS